MKQTPLSFYKAMHISGSDAETFLQGQLTNDLSKTSADEWQLSAYCTPKGDVIAIFHIQKVDDGFIIITDESVYESTFKRLKMFVLRSDVVFTEMDSTVFGNLDDNTVTLSLTVASDAEPCSPEAWQVTAMQNQWPRISAEHSQKHVAQFLNLDLNDGVDFKKGCYAGQEVIARLHYRGKATKRMVAMNVDGLLECSESLELHYNDFSANLVVLQCLQSNNDTWLQGILSLKALEAAQGHFKVDQKDCHVIQPE